ncbi:SRPBCC domain-containing protein [Peterkaempfera sp. SMS 1(5)a]|uniref:SRPBCC domain-containing protein n=1 Tax=Peterkaempfera podocarpi TaxID=3232308 RepID=UPI003671B155
MTDRSTTHATFTLERVYDAPVERVFAAWGDPVAKSRWFAGVKDASSQSPAMELDFQVGGTERTVGTPQEGGPVYTYEGWFHDILPHERIVLTNRIQRDSELISVNLVSIQFTAEGAGTRLTVIDHGAYLDGHDRAEWRETGTRDQLDRLEGELVARPSAGAE